MSVRLCRAGKIAAVLIGVFTLAALSILALRDVFPGVFPGWAHDFLAAFSLSAIALAYLAYQLACRPTCAQFLRAIMVAAAFFFWAANQYWSSLPQAAIFNDIAIGLFVVDLFLVIASRPSMPGSEFAQSGAEQRPGE